MPSAGVTVARIQEHLAARPEALSDYGAIELLGTLVRHVAVVHHPSHDGAAAPCHGALNARHVALTRDGVVVLGGSGLAAELQPLQLNRERLWREFGLALPAAAGVPRFDQRADVTQLGVIGVALLLRRPLTDGEYPRPIGELLIEATSSRTLEVRLASALRTWLQQAIQLNARGNFASAIDAARDYAELPLPTGARRTGAQGMRALVDTLVPAAATLSEAVA